MLLTLKFGKSRVLGFLVAPLVSLALLALWNELIEPRITFSLERFKIELGVLYVVVLAYSIPVYLFLRKYPDYLLWRYVVAGFVCGLGIMIYSDFHLPLFDQSIADYFHGYWGLPTIGALGGAIFWIFSFSRRE